MRLESGPAKADRNWQLVRTVIFLGFALYFVYDGALGWPRKNRVEAERKLAAPEPFGGQVKYDRLGETPTKNDFDKLLKGRPTRLDQVRAALGEPTFTKDADHYFMSRYGYARVSSRSGTVALSPTDWVTWAKTRDEIRQQFVWAIVPALPGLYFLWRLIKAMTLRVTIDDEGMVYSGRRIAFADMVSLRDYNPKGWIDLYYNAGAAQRKLRLDNEKVKLFDEIIAAICDAKGFRNEQQEYAARKAREEAEAAADAESAEAEATEPPADDDKA